MPCRSDYMDPTTKERNLSRVACLIDELAGRKWTKSEWDGYHPRVYNERANADALVKELCSKLQEVDVTKYSLEMQMWWRDHMEADKKRVEQELQSAKDEKERKAALEKLTPHERRLLGLGE